MHYRTRQRIDLVAITFCYALPAWVLFGGYGAPHWLFVLALLGILLSIVGLSRLREDDDADDYGALHDYGYVLPIYGVYWLLLWVATALAP